MTTHETIPETVDDVLKEFRDCGALLEGHFKLSSGRHSGHYLQCARVLMDPARAGRLAQAIVNAIPDDVLDQVDVVVSPAMGGIIVGHEVARVLKKDGMFLERPEGTFHLRRGFALEPGAKVLMVEDVVTTGLSSREAIDAVAREGGEVIAECALIDRSLGSADLGVPFYPLAAFDFPTYDENDIPDALASVAVTKPGSRK
ncbi:orotate phosphoribosyltransferase [Erythrobacter sp. Alg231-14]|uniref:orotate phosphoribosyltransferase n=1 Tax=Erythrobacter sp. Alg231-14 TaxID=1922225 RepID=UPI000D54FE0B